MVRDEFVIDRIEDKFIVLEDSVGELINITNEFVEGIPKEGDVLVKVDNKYIIDYKATESRRERINSLMKGMWEE